MLTEKSKLHEWAQVAGVSIPEYTTVRVEGSTAHRLRWRSTVLIEGNKGTGSFQGKEECSTKKKAEQCAAAEALRHPETLNSLVWPPLWSSMVENVIHAE
jgi:dsRNA-specific ribonuclease